MKELTKIRILSVALGVLSTRIRLSFWRKGSDLRDIALFTKMAQKRSQITGSCIEVCAKQEFLDRAIGQSSTALSVVFLYLLAIRTAMASEELDFLVIASALLPGVWLVLLHYFARKSISGLATVAARSAKE